MSVYLVGDLVGTHVYCYTPVDKTFSSSIFISQVSLNPDLWTTSKPSLGSSPLQTHPKLPTHPQI